MHAYDIYDRPKCPKYTKTCTVSDCLEYRNPAYHACPNAIRTMKPDAVRTGKPDALRIGNIALL